MAQKNGTKPPGTTLESPLEPAAPDTTGDSSAVSQPSEPKAYQLVEMKAEAELAEAGRGILHQQLLKLRKAEPVARDGSDPEGIHDMRVATRRLRAALKLLGETVYRPKVTDRYRNQLRKLANALGDTRDTDVFIQHLEEYIALQPEEERAGLEPLRQELLGHRALSRKRMLKALDNYKTEKLLRKLEHFATHSGAGVASGKAGEDEVAPHLVRHFASSAVWRRYEEVLAYETVVGPETPIATLHRLRVACKRLRYTLEFFQEALPTTFKNLHSQLVAVQDELGILHDHQVASQLAERLLREYPDDQALRAYHASRVAEMERIRAAFPAIWRNLAGSAYRKQLAATIAGMGNDTAVRPAHKASVN